MGHNKVEMLLPYAVRAAVVGGVVAAMAYWLFVDRGVYIGRAQVSVLAGIFAWGGIEWMLYRQARPERLEFIFEEAAGYWVHELKEWTTRAFDPKTIRICIATDRERDQLPKPVRKFGMQLVGKVHCIVEDRFWVWQETLPWAETEGGVLGHPSVFG